MITVVNKKKSLKNYIFLLAISSCTRVNSLHLAATVEETMTMGGDDRITIPANTLCNKYFTAPRQNDSVIARSSSTSSSASPQGFAAASKLFNRLRIANDTGNGEMYFQQIMHFIRSRIKKFWGYKTQSPCLVITAPSGTDAEMLPAFAALARHPNWHLSLPTSPLVTNIIVASGEVGSGTALAAQLHHFSKITPRGNITSLGQPITDVPINAIAPIEISIRNSLGAAIPLDDIETEITEILKKAITDEGQIAVLHMVHACKTGLGAPREDFIYRMKTTYGDNLIIVVDAAQLRMNENVTQRWLDQGYWVLLTGSKFLGGPSFSGALLIPAHDAHLLAQVPVNAIPAGLGEYFSPDDCDLFFTNLRSSLPTWNNTGLALRWEAALAVAEKFCSINQEQRDRGISTWVRGVTSMIRTSQCLHLLDEVVNIGNKPCDFTDESFNGFTGACNSVISFGLQINSDSHDSRYLTLAELRKVYEYLTQDLRQKLPAMSAEESTIAATSCLIGQPVKIGTTGKCAAVLRIAIGIPHILPAIEKERLDPAVLIDEILEDDRIVIKKLELIVKHWSALSS